VRDPRRARRAATRHAHRAHASRPSVVPRHAGRVPSLGQSRVQSLHGSRGMSVLAFYARNSQEALGLVWQHVSLVAISTGAAILIAVPLGIALTRRPAWRAPVLALANVFQTVLTLGCFWVVVPLP